MVSEAVRKGKLRFHPPLEQHKMRKPSHSEEERQAPCSWNWAVLLTGCHKRELTNLPVSWSPVKTQMPSPLLSLWEKFCQQVPVRLVSFNQAANRNNFMVIGVFETIGCGILNDLCWLSWWKWQCISLPDAGSSHGPLAGGCSRNTFRTNNSQFPCGLQT